VEPLNESKEQSRARTNIKNFKKMTQILYTLSILGLLPESLAKIEDLFIVDGKRVIVYEHCLGKNLLEDVLVNEQEKLPEYRVKKIVHQILTGLRFLHSKNIFHGHMTPQCIVFDDYEAGTIKMTGFGYHTLLAKNVTN
jgi:serine/threonine protein kinase